MFEVGKTYYYNGMVHPYFRTEEAYKEDRPEYIYLEKRHCQLTHGGKTVTLRQWAWEPLSWSTPCVCISVDPLIFDCEYKCVLTLSDKLIRQHTVVRDSFARLGIITISDNEVAYITELFKWYLDNWNKARDVDTFLEFFVQSLNKDYLKHYTGSHNGALTFENNQKFLFNMLFGIKKTPILIYLLYHEHMKLVTNITDNKLCLFVGDMTIDQYIKDELQIEL